METALRTAGPVVPDRSNGQRVHISRFEADEVQ